MLTFEVEAFFGGIFVLHRETAHDVSMVCDRLYNGVQPCH